MHVTSPVDSSWYLDARATNHMTHAPLFIPSLPRPLPLIKLLLVMVHLSSSLTLVMLPFSSGSFAFRHSDVLHITSLCKNLMSITQLTRDFLVSVMFYSWGYNIRDLYSGKLFLGQCKDDLYPVLPSSFPSSRSTQALASVVILSTLWYRRLDHQSDHVLRKLVSPSL